MIQIVDGTRKCLVCDSYGCPRIFRKLDHIAYIGDNDEIRLRAMRCGWRSIESVDWYTEDFCPERSAETKEELEEARDEQRRETGQGTC